MCLDFRRSQISVHPVRWQAITLRLLAVPSLLLYGVAELLAVVLAAAEAEEERVVVRGRRPETHL